SVVLLERVLPHQRYELHRLDDGPRESVHLDEDGELLRVSFADGRHDAASGGALRNNGFWQAWRRGRDQDAIVRSSRRVSRAAVADDEEDVVHAEASE